MNQTITQWFLRGATVACLMVAAGCATNPTNPDATYTIAKSADASALTVMSFNIRLGLGTDNPKGKIYRMKWGRELNGVIEAIRSANPDIVALQEVAGKAQMDKMARALKMYGAFEYHKTSDGRSPWWGVAVLSKYPIRGQRGVQISYGVGNNKSILIADIETPQGPVAAVSIHKDKDTKNGRPFKVAMKALQSVPNPVLLMGDLNIRPSDPRMNLVANRFEDSLNSVTTAASTYAKKRGTWRARNSYRIDYVMPQRNRFEVIDAGVVDAAHHGASDHIGVVARVRIKR